MREAAALPGVTHTGLSSGVPLGMATPECRSDDADSRRAAHEGVQASWRIVSGGYFRRDGRADRAGRVFVPGRNPQNPW